MIKEKYDNTINNKKVLQHQKNDDNNSKWDHAMKTRPEGSEVADSKTEPHNLKNFDDFRTKGVSSEHNNKGEKNDKEKKTEDDNNNIRKYNNIDSEVKKCD